MSPAVMVLEQEQQTAAPTSTGEPAQQLQPAPAAGGPERRPAMPALTGLRTCLALIILLFHFTPAGLRWEKHPWLSLYPIIDIGYVFVSFFFLISGFILSYNYAHRPGGVRPLDFWMARLSRLYPVYALALMISIPMLMVEWHNRPHGEFFTGMVLTPLLLQGFSPKLATFWNTVSWTLSCEVVLYLAFPWLAKLRWPRSPWKLAAMVLGFWLLNLTPHSLYIWLNPDHLPHGATRFDDATWLDFLKYTPFAYVFTFMAGLTLGRLLDALDLQTRGRTWCAAAGFGIAYIVVYHLAPHLPYILVHGGLLTPMWALIILGLSGPGPFARVFSWKPLVAIGTSTYCLYLLHFNVMELMQWHHVTEHLHISKLDPWISYVIVVLFAMAVRRWVEHPMQKVIQGWWKAHKERKALATAA